MWPYRAGGLLDSGGGERFGIWATYALAISIAFLFSKYKLYAIPFITLSILSIIANNTRATFLALILILLCYLIFFIKNRYIKWFLLFSTILSILIFINFSQNFPKRYNAHTVLTNLELITKYHPKQDMFLVQKHQWDSSTAIRLSMWKSVIIYRLKEPFLPQGYGRFLYGKGIQNNFKDTPQNMPYRVFIQAHNDYIGTLYSLGIIGLLAFIYLLYYKLKVSYKLYSLTDNNSYKILSVFLFLGTIGFMTSIMFGSFFGDSEVKFFYPLYGLLLGIYYKEINTNEKNTLY
jgi:O-antigen ligase